MDAQQSLKWGARAGYAARGIVYLVVGGLAVLAAIGSGGTEDTQGALRKLFHQPFGGVILAVLALGLIAFSGWRFVQAVGDPDRLGSGGKGVVIRLAMFASGLLHLALAAFAASLLFALDFSSGGSGGDPTEGWLRWLFGHKWGRWVALALALVPLAIGVAHVWKGWQAGYAKYFKPGWDHGGLVKPVCSFGLVARGVVFLVIGLLAIYAGGIYDVESAPGLEDALEWIQGLPFGWVALLLVALGLIAFAVYAFVEAAYRRIDVERASL